MTAAGFRRIVLSLDGVIESAHMGHPDFRVNGRIFATLKHDEQHGMVKLTPAEQARFTGATLERVRIIDTVLDGCELSGALLEEAMLERVELRNCRMSGVVMISSRLRDVRFVGSPR